MSEGYQQCDPAVLIASLQRLSPKDRLVKNLMGNLTVLRGGHQWAYIDIRDGELYLFDHEVDLRVSPPESTPREGTVIDLPAQVVVFPTD